MVLSFFVVFVFAVSAGEVRRSYHTRMLISTRQVSLLLPLLIQLTQIQMVVNANSACYCYTLWDCFNLLISMIDSSNIILTHVVRPTFAPEGSAAPACTNITFKTQKLRRLTRLQVGCMDMTTGASASVLRCENDSCFWRTTQRYSVHTVRLRVSASTRWRWSVTNRRHLS